MPGFYVSPLAVVNQIKSNLQDRYESGYPILKELLQNADDAQARRFRLEALSGWPDAGNPLLQGPGLLVVNDGALTDDDRSGILAFGESVKATDRAAIGKFGLGQKAVFHLCDAFVVHAVGVEEPFTRVVNPFLKVEIADNVTGCWERVSEADIALLRRAVQDFGERALLLWLPLRRDDLIPAPNVGFSAFRHDSETIAKELARTDDVRVLLTALRHLESIEVRGQGQTLCSVRVGDTQGRLRGPDDQPPCKRSFRGTIDTGPEDSVKFVGRETTIHDQDLECLRCSDQWPKTISVLRAESEPEKGEQHGAVTLLRTGKAVTQRSELRISWAVFLPISETGGCVLPIEAPDFGQMHLLLHGYFFLDSGRRHVEGLDEPANHEEPMDEACLRHAWNTRLRDAAVLPLVPALLKDAFDEDIMTARDLAHLATAIAKSTWFEAKRAAICKEQALVRVLHGLEVPRSGRVAWELVPTSVEMRFMPATLADSPELADRLFRRIDQWAQDRAIKLCIDRNASLTAESVGWTATELDSLFATLSAQAFQSEPLAVLLTDLLSEADLNDEARAVLAPHLVSALRKAMLEPGRMVSRVHLSSILRHVPRDRLFALPTAVKLRAVLRALASSNAAVLPVRSEWLHDADRQTPASETGLNDLLRALARLIDGDAGDLANEAAAAAHALLYGHRIPTLAIRPKFHDIKILRARDPLKGSIVVLSFGELMARSRQGFLFRRSPNVEIRLRTLVGALPGMRPLIVDTAMDRLGDSGDNGLHELTCTANKEAFFALIARASRFGPAEDRARMIKMLSSLEGTDAPTALRQLCAGDEHASAAGAVLWNGDDLPADIERIIGLFLEQREKAFLVPSRVVTELSGRQRKDLSIRDLDTPGMERLIEGHIDTFSGLKPSDSERWGFFKTDLRADLLRRLPIHDRSDGTVGSAEGVFRKDGGWSIPDRFRDWVVTVRLIDDPETQAKQKRIIRTWSPQAQIELALSQTESHRYQEEVLAAISKLRNDGVELPSALIDCLRTTCWLTIGDTPVAPRDVLTLPPSVDEAAQRRLDCVSVGRLPERIRTHPEFRYAQEKLMPDRRSSLATLAQMIDSFGLQGRLGAAEDYPIDQFAELANIGADLKLPGWSLLAAVLSSIDDDPDLVLNVAGSFHEVSDAEAEKAGCHLEALAEIADHDAAHREAAEQAFRHGFKAVSTWTGHARQRVFGNTRVPTKSGAWRSGKKVLAEDNGVAPAHVLAREYAPMLATRYDALRVREVDAASRPDDKELDIEVLQMRSASQHHAFLEGWRGSIPPELVAVYLGIVGRHNRSLESYRAEWTKDATMNIDHELDALAHDKRMPALFLIEEIRGPSIEAIALSGDRFCAPLGDHTSLRLVVGNRHKQQKYLSPFGRGELKRTRIVVMQVRTTDHGVSSVGDRASVFREFIETAAAECLSDEAMDALRGILDRAARVEQATFEDTQRLLRDRLPTLLTALKIPTQSSAHYALRLYEEAEIRASDYDKAVLKMELWESIHEPAASMVLLEAVRARIKDQGYGEHRVLFELFQNADDAYVQRESDSADACFRVDFGSTDDRRLQIVHWGRPINHPGPNAEAGRRLGYDRDLLNMLVMSFSGKRPEEGVSGKFGLGFKCVHLLSDSVGVASGFVSLRTVGGVLPEQWPDGLRIADELSRADGSKATVVDIPYTTQEMAVDGRRTEQAFRDAMTWLPAVACRIRRITVLGSAPGTIDCEVSCLPGAGGDGSIDVVAVRDTWKATQRALRFDLRNGYSLLLKVGADGPEGFEPSVGRVWNLAPLEESVSSGWLLNGPFPVDPGRGRLAGSIEDRQKRFVKLGRALGERLLALHDLVENDWKALAGVLDLRIADGNLRGRFWSRLFDVMSRDLDDGLARRLHAVDRGYGRLVTERPVAPTRLPRPFDVLVCASSVEMFTDKALAETGILQATRNWRSADHLKDRIVASEVATLLKKLGFVHIQPITLSELLRMEMGEDKRIDVELGIRLGQVITPDSIQKPLHQEQRQISEAASHASFRARDDTWRPVRSLSSKECDDESLLCDFAPDDALLHGDYRDESLHFFKVARMQSGYGPGGPLLRRWLDAANDQRRRRAVLRYLVRGRQGPALAQLVREDPPHWMADVPARFSSHPLLDGWTDEERKKLVVQLDPTRLEDASPSIVRPLATSDVAMILEKLHKWWMAERHLERRRYEGNVYPQGFNASSLAGVDGVDDRTSWFTMFALACYQLFGRTQDEQHRSFIESGWQEGWWAELARSEPPGDVQPWLDRLERWSAPDRFDQTYHQWQRTLVDLYTIARGLNEYVELIRTLPRIVQKEGRVSLDDILQPSYSPRVGPLGLNAAPVHRSLGIGANWLIRELSRIGVYDSDEANLMAPYCWAPSQRVRAFFTTLDPNLDLTAADKDASPAIYDFVFEHVGTERALFDGDFDLPLQIVTQKRHIGLLNRWFEEVELDAPEFGNDSVDDDDYA